MRIFKKNKILSNISLDLYFLTHLNNSIWISNKKDVTKIVTVCRVDNLGIELGQSNFGTTNGLIFKICF
jgi:hypothetical protein